MHLTSTCLVPSIKRLGRALNWLKNLKPGNDIASKITEQVAEEQIRRRKGILAIIDLIIALGQRGIAFRGNWEAKQNEEDGNFSFFLHWKAKTDDDLAQHLKFAQTKAKLHVTSIIERDNIFVRKQNQGKNCSRNSKVVERVGK